MSRLANLGTQSLLASGAVLLLALAVHLGARSYRIASFDWRTAPERVIVVERVIATTRSVNGTVVESAYQVIGHDAEHGTPCEVSVPTALVERDVLVRFIGQELRYRVADSMYGGSFVLSLRHADDLIVSGEAGVGLIRERTSFEAWAAAVFFGLSVASGALAFVLRSGAVKEVIEPPVARRALLQSIAHHLTRRRWVVAGGALVAAGFSAVTTMGAGPITLHQLRGVVLEESASTRYRRTLTVQPATGVEPISFELENEDLRSSPPAGTFVGMSVTADLGGDVVFGLQADETVYVAPAQTLARRAATFRRVALSMAVLALTMGALAALGFARAQRRSASVSER